MRQLAAIIKDKLGQEKGFLPWSLSKKGGKRLWDRLRCIPLICSLNATHIYTPHPPPYLQDVGHKRSNLIFQDRNKALTNQVVDQTGKLSHLQQPDLCLFQLLLQLLALYPLKVDGALAYPDPVAVLHSLLQALLHVVRVIMNLLV